MVFALIAFFDLLVLIFIAVSIVMGKYGDPPKNMELDDDASKKNEAATATYQGAIEDGGFADEFLDVPFN